MDTLRLKYYHSGESESSSLVQRRATSLNVRIVEALAIVVLVLAGHVSCDTLIDGIVHIRCGRLEDNRATITYFGDSHKVTAYMKDGGSCLFEQDVATATWSLDVVFSAGDSSRCQMTQLPHRKIYSLQVISRRGSSGLESENDEKYLMECNYEPYREEEDQKIYLVDKLDPPQVVEVKAGKKSNSIFILQVIGIEGQILTSVVIGRVVRLKVIQLPSQEDEGQGFEPVMCDVMTPDEDQVTSVLIDGCGTGYPFSKTRGFQMDGTVGISPPFRMFRLQPFKDVHFRCTFVTCHGDCIGSSCDAENVTQSRSRRGTVVNHYATVIARTQTQQVLGHPEGPPTYSRDDYVMPAGPENTDASKQPLANEIQPGNRHPVEDPTSVYNKWFQVLVDSKIRQTRNQNAIVIGKKESSLLLQNVNFVLLSMSILLLSIFIGATLYLVGKFR